MGFTLDLIKGIIKKRTGLFKGKEPEAPKYPLGLAVGKTVKLDDVSFLLGDGELMLPPPGERCTVVAIAQYELLGRKVLRFYLEADETDVNREWNRTYILEISQEKPDAPLDLCRLYWPRIEEMPTDWKPFLDEGGVLWWFETQIPRSFEEGDQDMVVYQRVWGAGESMKPLAYNETVLGGGETIKYPYVNLFAREYDIADGKKGKEYFLLAVVENSEGAFLQGIVGIDVDHTGITIL